MTTFACKMNFGLREKSGIYYSISSFLNVDTCFVFLFNYSFLLLFNKLTNNIYLENSSFIFKQSLFYFKLIMIKVIT